MIGRLFMLSGIPAMWLNDCCSLTVALIAGMSVFVLLIVMDSSRGNRSKPSSIMARFMFGVWTFVFLFFYVLGNTAAGRTYFAFADCFVISFWITLIVTALFWTCTWVGSLVVNGDPDYRRWRQAGGHYFWDTLPRILNPDSVLIRNGGFAEPTYTGFVPPEDWQHQCPLCGVRVQHSFGVCWNCNYGADGDSTAFHQRHGR